MSIIEVTQKTYEVTLQTDFSAGNFVLKTDSRLIDSRNPIKELGY